MPEGFTPPISLEPAQDDPFATPMTQPMAQPGEMPHAIMPEQERELGGGGSYEPIPLLGGGSPALRPGATEPAPGDPYAAPAKAAPARKAEQAAPITAYHAAEQPFASFDPTRMGANDPGHLGQGFYFSTDPAIGRSSPTTLAADLNVQNPLKVSLPDFKTDKQAIVRDALGLSGDASAQDVTSALVAKGHDGVMLDYSPTGYAHQEIMVPDAGQIQNVREMPPSSVTPLGGGAPRPGPDPAAEAAPAKQPPLLKQQDPFSNPIDTHPQEKALNVNEILHPDNPAIDPATGEPYKSRSRNVTEIASDLHDRSQAALKDLGIKSGQITGPNPVTDELIARSMAAEAKAALSRPGANASDWYTGRINEGMGAAAAMYPEIAINPNARTAFQAALAITSQGETVPSNVRLATQAYEYYRQNGRFPEDIVAKEAPSMNTNFGKLNDLVDTGGPDGMREFLNQQTTVRALKDLGHSVGGENMDTPVYGSAILGPKIGQGFFQNLGGNFDPVTMDLWFMRHWGRQTGTLVGASDTSAQKLRLQNALGDAGLPVPRTDTQLMNRAQQIFADHERDFVVNRDLYNSGEKTKSELTNAAQRWIYANQGINQSPTSGGQRNWMRSVVGRAREILAGEGHDVTNADLQAILWYPEKDLYSKLGGRESAGINVDYATTLTNAARAKGVPENELQQAIRAASGRPGPSGGAGEPGGAGGNPPQAAGALPQAPAQNGASPAAGAAPEAPGISLEPANGDPYGGS